MKPLTPNQHQTITNAVPELDRLVNKLSRSPEERGDVRSSVYFAACQAASSWDPEKGESFITWVLRYAKRQVAHDRRSTALPVTVPTYAARNVHRDEKTFTDLYGDYVGRMTLAPNPDVLDSEQQSEILHDCTAVAGKFSSDIRDILNKKFIEGLTLEEIASIKRISKQRVHQIIASAFNRVKYDPNGEYDMGRGRKTGSKKVRCRVCNQTMMISPNTSKTCRHCTTEYSVEEINDWLSELVKEK